MDWLGLGCGGGNNWWWIIVAVILFLFRCFKPEDCVS